MATVILVVDDDPLVRNVVMNMLGAAGYKTLGACSGKEALEISSNYSGEIDLVITDITMPEMDGLELAHKMRQGRPLIKILTMSGRDSSKVKAGSHSLPFLQKPFRYQPLIDKVRIVLQNE